MIEHRPCFRRHLLAKRNHGVNRRSINVRAGEDVLKLASVDVGLSDPIKNLGHTQTGHGGLHERLPICEHEHRRGRDIADTASIEHRQGT